MRRWGGGAEPALCVNGHTELNWERAHMSAPIANGLLWGHSTGGRRKEHWRADPRRGGLWLLCAKPFWHIYYIKKNLYSHFNLRAQALWEKKASHYNKVLSHTQKSWILYFKMYIQGLERQEYRGTETYFFILYIFLECIAHWVILLLLLFETWQVVFK